MIGLSVRGDDLAGFVRTAGAAAADATKKAPKRAAANASAELKVQIKQRFKRVPYWNSPGFAKAIRWKEMGPGWWRTYSRAVYVKGRSEPVDLLWFFDQPQKTVSSSSKSGVAVPLPDSPLASSGKRYAWPSELMAQGWQLEFLPTRNPNVQLIVGRLGHGQRPKPLFLWLKQTRPRARLDLEGLFQKHAATLDDLWAGYVDEALERKPRRLS